jgi:hypothetical protein
MKNIQRVLHIICINYLSMIATTPIPPAVQILIRIRPLPSSFRILAAVAIILPPVAAKG